MNPRNLICVILLSLNSRLIWRFFKFQIQRQSWAIENDSKYIIFCVFSINCFIFVDLHFLNCVSVYIYVRYQINLLNFVDTNSCALLDWNYNIVQRTIKTVLLSTFVKLCIVNTHQWYKLRFSRYVAVKHAVCGLLAYFICSNGSKFK